MFGLPKSTEISKQVAKTAIYAKFSMTNSAMEKFDADVSRISLIAEISPASVSIAAGKNVKSIFVMLIKLKKADFNPNSITLLSKLIDQKILLMLEFEDKTRPAVFHNKLILGEWKQTDDVTVSLEGLDLDGVWENIVKNIAEVKNEESGMRNEELSLDELLAQQEKLKKILKEIEKLEKQVKNEKQPKKKFEIVQEIHKLKKLLTKTN